MERKIGNNDFIGYLKKDLNNAGDGLIRQIKTNLGDREIVVELSVLSSEGWINLEIIAEKISEFRIRQKQNEDLQVIFNLDIQKIGNRYWFDFDSSDPNKGVEEFRTSNFYFVCETFNVLFLPYKE
ncbi:hypothetical protein J8L13_16620 [Bacteroides fragilis]|uniref:hypothetical protein n=1 Tax=Bacteroides TaxID=816 RepID=UPI00203016CD|nr:hypothetical protein [Bacteroides fragilis]MCM0239010.1 hypothetical protein [Bacteroides fragilis]